MYSDRYLSSCSKSMLSGKCVLLRLDLDTPKSGSGFDLERMLASIPTIKFLLEQDVKHIGIIGHMGRPRGQVDKSLSTIPLFPKLLTHIPLARRKQVSMFENLRFNPGEEQNILEFAHTLSKDYDLYVFDAFATAHRRHASVVTIPTLLPTFFGLSMERELTNLAKLFTPKRPYLAIVGGSKPETKLDLIHSLAQIANTVLVGGALARQEHVHLFTAYPNVIVAKLRKNELDISEHSILEFCRHIADSATIVWDGPLGKVEDKANETGTKKILDAIRQSSAFSVIGGGDTISFCKRKNYHPTDRSYLCMGGGAMLYYLTHQTFPLLELFP